MALNSQRSSCPHSRLCRRRSSQEQSLYSVLKTMILAHLSLDTCNSLGSTSLKSRTREHLTRCKLRALHTFDGSNFQPRHAKPNSDAQIGSDDHPSIEDLSRASQRGLDNLSALATDIPALPCRYFWCASHIGVNEAEMTWPYSVSCQLALQIYVWGFWTATTGQHYCGMRQQMCPAQAFWGVGWFFESTSREAQGAHWSWMLCCVILSGGSGDSGMFLCCVFFDQLLEVGFHLDYYTSLDS